MTKEYIDHEFRLKETDEKINYFIDQIMQNELISKKHKNVYKALNYIEHYTYFSIYSY